MTRISKKVNELISFDDDIHSWIDFGTGDGKVVKSLKWNDEAIFKLAVDKMVNEFDDDWEVYESLNDVPYGHVSLFTGFDIIEHMYKDEGRIIIEDVLEISDHSIFFTPDGFLQQDENNRPELVRKNPYQKHLSGWTKEDFEYYGYNVVVLKNFHYYKWLDKKYNALLAWL